MAKKSPAGQAFSHIADTARQSPAVGRLTDATRAYAFARGTQLAERLGDHAGNLTGKLQDFAEGGGQLNFKGEAGKRILGGAGPVKAGLGTAASKVKDKVKSVLGKGKGKGSGKPKVVSIVESIDVGVPVSVAYDQWTQFTEFSKFMKGISSVEQQDETTTTWRAKVAKSQRSWQGKVVEQIPDRRIVWTSDGKKGSTKGVVTFHALTDDLTRILLDIEYYPTGLVEKTGNIWRAVGRRARLDLKHFRRFVMAQGEATGSWRGEIRDGEVVRKPDEQDDEAGRRPDEARQSTGRSRGSQGGDSSTDGKQSKPSSERQGREQQHKEDSQAEDANAEDTNAEDTNAEDTNAEDTKAQDTNKEASADRSSQPKAESHRDGQQQQEQQGAQQSVQQS
ncbi:MAG: SRPBCC family protein [Catenulispora sp.]